ncbi:hypothetical protein [Pseudoalteromonas luteoviolacea]|uniref:Solute-binding protein family 3/N-terminal domain-containing protein n=1 Tax=Pseudoalteromonas luteoviolacea NCIMB 1942 TaxID=1365253 RepID=A0A167HTY2_9GAMM|nr:hypothetical protein [Pseudoalteromonas luteoviolacea]KZN58523.1 hypothetical protein N482_22190 [Pseudoalteromonas luteoviolacea NCIMB 1942]
MKLLIAMAAILFALQSVAKEYNINVSESMSFHLGKKQVEQIFTAIYEPLDIAPQFHYLPSQRGLRWVNLGQFDAEAGRVESAMHQFDSLIPIPTPLATVRLAVFCLDPQFCQVNYKEGMVIIKGSLLSVQFCERFALNCHAVQNTISAFQALAKSHSLQLLATDHFSIGSLCDSGLQKIYMYTLPGQGVNVRHYIHKKHLPLLSKIDLSIKEKLANGELNAFINRLSNEFANCNGEIIELVAPPSPKDQLYP